MSSEKIGELFGVIDLVIDDSLAPDTMVMHNGKEAVILKDGKVAKVDMEKEWRDYSMNPSRRASNDG